MTLALMHVDDEPDIREVAAMALELDPNLSLVSVGSGQEALDLIAAGQAPDVILLDFMMPIMDGPGVLKRLRAMSGQELTPVIFMTARAQTSEVDQLKALGAIGVIVKPFDPMTLADQVRGLLAEAKV
ncbi:MULTISPECIES: response regulator [unclassified Brevundimonas]|uniref:response regulator n=1 Tax=unclassified Brevundimonas TaxID=2622653 RepID=UPI0025C5FE7D|nr:MULTISPECIES: response regulator [unclassified Brevundimonas]